MSPINLRVEGVNKAFHGQRVLSDVSVEMTGGHVYGLVGRNGSGKTVLLKMLCGQLQPDVGHISVSGHPIRCGKILPARFGVTFDSAGFIPRMSGYKNLRLLAGIRNVVGQEAVRRAIEAVGLDWRDRKKISAYSLGMRQRLMFAQALMEDPDILLLDEPMNGLDADAMADVRRWVLAEREKGKLIVVATHVAADIQLLCDHVYKMDAGVLVQLR